MMNADLYAALPPNKREEYKKMFPEPTYIRRHTIDSSGYCWIWNDLTPYKHLPIESYEIGAYKVPDTGGYISTIQNEGMGAVAFFPIVCIHGQK